MLLIVTVLVNICFVHSRYQSCSGQIKVACDKEEGIACQVIRAETFLKMRGSDGRNAVARNISMKINAKLGGINYDLAKDPG